MREACALRRHFTSSYQASVKAAAEGLVAGPLPNGVGLSRAPGASPRRSDGGFSPSEVKPTLPA